MKCTSAALRASSSGLGENLRGTYAAYVQKIPYLKQSALLLSNYFPFFQFHRRTGPGQNQ